MSATCTRTYQIIVTGDSPTFDYSWWKMEEDGSDPRTDSVRGFSMVPFGSATFGRSAGVIDFAFAMDVPKGTFAGISVAVASAFAAGADGTTVVGWFKVGAAPTDVTAPFDFGYYGSFGGNPVLIMDCTFVITPAGCINARMSTLSGASVNITFDGGQPPLGQWCFVAMVYDSNTGMCHCYTGLNGVVSGPFSIAQSDITDAGNVFMNALPSGTGSGDTAFELDEVGWFDGPLTLAQVTYLYNGGAGRTSPITFP